MNTVKLPNIKENFADWYNEVIFRSELAENAPIRGCIVVRPYGYAIWELMQKELDEGIKAMGAQNAAFPLLIPENFIKAEAEHIEGFAPELAVVTLAGGKKLEETLIVRPTSETIIHHMFSRWIKSWRDLPLKVNQWCSVVRWEKRPRPFIRTTEFWWQEGHTAHGNCEEAYDQAHEAWSLYAKYVRGRLAIPVLMGKKPEHEKFAGAIATFTFEGMMQDGKALQMGTSHVLSQTFAKSFNICFQNKDGNIQHPFLTSWGVTTRLIGSVIMVHGDQYGLVLPPAVAPYQVVIVPITKASDQEKILEVCQQIYSNFKQSGLRVIFDDGDESPGSKYYKWELKGVPIRIELGMRDLIKEEFCLFERDTREKRSHSLNILFDKENITKFFAQLFEAITNRMYIKALKKQNENYFKEDTLAFFGPKISEQNGFYETWWCGDPASVDYFKAYQATIRCVLEEKENGGNCCIHPACQGKYKIVVAKAY